MIPLSSHLVGNDLAVDFHPDNLVRGGGAVDHRLVGAVKNNDSRKGAEKKTKQKEEDGVTNQPLKALHEEFLSS